MTFADLSTLFSTHWGAAVAIGSMFFGLTVLSVRMLDPGIRHTIALRLMGVEQENWCRSFCALFDSCFGRNHLSLLCILRSGAASLLAVSILWLIFGAQTGLAGRASDTLPFWQLALIALGINLVADYVSLLETRWLLGQMQRWTSAWAQAVALVVDALVTGAIILVAIFAYQASPLYDGAAMSVGEIIGVFSVFGVLFYSTFLTSVWTWGYILSSWVIRLFTWAKLDKVLDLEDSLPFVAGVVMALVVGTGTFAGSVPFKRDGLSGRVVFEDALCFVFGGTTCIQSARFLTDEQLRARRVLEGCSTGAPTICFSEGIANRHLDPLIAERYWQASCDGGDARACFSLGHLFQSGRGVPRDIGRAHELFSRGCHLGDQNSCLSGSMLSLLGDRSFPAFSLPASYTVRLCDEGQAESCFLLGAAAYTSSPAQLDAARELFIRACALDPHHRACAAVDRMTQEIGVTLE